MDYYLVECSKKEMVKGSTRDLLILMALNSAKMTGFDLRMDWPMEKMVELLKLKDSLKVDCLGLLIVMALNSAQMKEIDLTMDWPMEKMMVFLTTKDSLKVDCSD
jgi:hypothetical protein